HHRDEAVLVDALPHARREDAPAGGPRHERRGEPPRHPFRRDGAGADRRLRRHLQPLLARSGGAAEARPRVLRLTLVRRAQAVERRGPREGEDRELAHRSGREVPRRGEEVTSRNPWRAHARALLALGALLLANAGVLVAYSGFYETRIAALEGSKKELEGK